MKIDEVYIEQIKMRLEGGGAVDVFWRRGDEFGHIYLYFYSDGKIRIDSEYMSKEFVKQVFDKLIDSAEIIE